MKSVVGRKIIILMSTAIVLTSVLISLLGIYLSEDVVSFYRGQSRMPNLSLLAELSLNYMDGDVMDAMFRDLVAGSEEEDWYIIYDMYGHELYKSETLPAYIETATLKSLNDITAGNTVFTRLDGVGDPLIELIGVPIIRDEQVVGAIFDAALMVDVAQLRYSFLRSLFIAIVIVMIFVNIIANIALRRIIKPIQNVVSAALAITEGDFSIKADEDLKGEIGLVGRVLNRLSTDLYRNISQLYLEKNRLDHVLNSLEEGMLAVDTDGRITHCNHVMEERFGIDGNGQKGVTIEGLPMIGERIQELMMVINERASYNVKMDYMESTYRIIIEPIEDEKDQVAGAVILFRDITESERLEDTRKNYVANVSHELRSPLTSIQGLIEPLMDDIVSDEGDKRRYYRIIYQENRRLARLVDDIMELSRLQDSEAMIQMIPTDLLPILLSAYERFKHMGANVNLLCKDKPMPQVIANSDRIEQILVILLDNAVKYSDDHEPITIDTSVEAGKIQVVIEDNGIGIPRKYQPYIFDRFFKADQPRTKKSTGLGLSIAKEILDLMGETITCESKEGAGTKFIFTLTIHHPST